LWREETALIESLEGNKTSPFPAVSGLWENRTEIMFTYQRMDCTLGDDYKKHRIGKVYRELS
jgi:NADH:ubiquinone oxidoreductase subunit F (NADH-binding)